MSLYDDASLIMYPSGYKEDKIYSLKPTDGSGDLTFTRASTATRVNAEGLIETSPVNLLTYSEQFDSWNTNAGATITANSTIAPNGTTTADTLTAAAISSSGIYKVITGNVVGQVYTASLYVKNNSGATSVKYQEENSAAAILFNATTGVITGTLGTVINSSVENVGNGWYKIQFAYTSTNPTNIFIIYSNLVVVNSFFIWGAQLNIGATAKPYFPTTDRLNVPRIDYTGGKCGSLLLEKQSTNLATYSEQIDKAAWMKFRSTITANDTTSPDGTTNADKIVENTENNSHGVVQAVSNASGQQYSVSVYVKAAERSWFVIYVGGGPAQGRFFNLSNGTLGNALGNTPNASSVTDAGNGWYRCSIVYTATDASSDVTFQSARTGATNIYTGDGTSGVYIWGAQVEASSYPTSYIPTLASSVTRLADAAFKTGISSLIGQTQGTLFGEFTFTGISPLMHLFCSVAGSFANAIYIQSYSSSGISMQVWSGVVNQVAIDSSGLTIGQNVKFAAAYKANDFAFYVNGMQVGTDTSGSVPAGLSQLEVGGYAESGSPFIYNNSMKQAIVFPTRLTNTQLQSLTSL